MHRNLPILSSCHLLIPIGKISSADLPIIGITEITSGVDVRNYREYKNSKASNFQTMLETQMVKSEDSKSWNATGLMKF